MTTGAGWGGAGWGVPDLGLDRVFDLSRDAVRRQTVRRRLFVVLTLIGGVGTILVLGGVWPATLRPVVELPFAVTLVGLGVMGLAILAMLVGIGTMVRAGSDPFDNHDPLLDLPRADRAWVRARVAAGAPVAPPHGAVVVEAAGWMARQHGTVPLYAGLALEGAGMVMSSLSVLGFAVGLLLLVEGPALAAIALVRSRSARRWLSLYAPAPMDD